MKGLDFAPGGAICAQLGKRVRLRTNGNVQLNGRCIDHESIRI